MPNKYQINHAKVLIVQKINFFIKAIK
jgi:hypothetical protein